VLAASDDEQKNVVRPAQLFALANAEAAKNILSNTLSTTGARFKNLIASLSPESSGHRTGITGTIPTQDPTLARQYLVRTIATISAVVVGIIIYFLRKKK